MVVQFCILECASQLQPAYGIPVRHKSTKTEEKVNIKIQTMKYMCLFVVDYEIYVFIHC